MKLFNFIVCLYLLSFFFASSSFSQVNLPEVFISSVKYKYLVAADNRNLAQPIKLLENQAASYDIKKADFYEDDYETYYITFYLPTGYVLATYDKDGKLLRTAERYKNVLLPKAVAQTLSKTYPGWSIPKDVYLVTYENEKGATKVWKVLLKQGDNRLKVKLNEKGEFISQ